MGINGGKRGNNATLHGFSPTTCNRMAESSSAETTTSSNFSGSSHSTNFSAYTSEAESDSEANSNEAGPSSRVVSLLDRLTVYTDVCKIIIKLF